MSNGNGFVPPEAKKKQAASQQGFVPPEVKKKESGQLGLDGSVQPIVSPSTDTRPIFPEGLEPIGAVAEYDKRRDEFVKRERDKFYEEAVSKLPSEQTTVGEDIVNALGAGTTRVVKSLMDTPGYVYNLLAAPQNYIADKYNIPELKASAEILTQQTERFIPDELNTIKAWGELSDKFGGDLEEREKEIQNKYDKSITEYYTNGEYSKGTGLLATRIAESIPYTVSIALTGGLGASPQALMGGIALMEGSQKAQQLREETELNELEIGLNSLASGLMEGVFEQTTAGIGRATRDILAREGKEAAKDFAEKSFKEVSERVLRKYLPATAPIGEGLSEVGTQVSQALIDKFTVDSSINPTEGLMDVFLIGAGSGAAISTPAYVASRFGSKESIDKRNELNKTKDKIDAALQNEELSETVKENLQNKREEIAKAESNILNNDYQKYKGYSEEDLNRVNEINRRLSSIKKTIEEIDDQDIKDSYVSEVENLVNEKTNIEEKYTTQVTKTEEDAIQKRKTEEVPVGEEAQVGEEVVGEVREQAEEVRGEEEEIDIEDVKFKIPSFNEQKKIKIGDAVLEIAQREKDGRWSVIELFVPENNRRKGIATRLITEAKKITEGQDFVAQVSNDASVDLHYKLGFRAFDENNNELSLEETKERRKTNSSVMMINIPEDEIDIEAYEQAVAEGDIDESLIDALTQDEINAAVEQQEQQAEAERLEMGDSGDKFMFIHENLGRIKPKDFDQYGDPNQRKGNKGFSIKYLSNKGLPLDVQAQAMSIDFGGEISPQDVIDYILDREANPEKYRGSKNKIKKLRDASRIALPSEEAYEVYMNLKNDERSMEALEELRGTVLSDEQVEIIKNHLKLIDETRKQQTVRETSEGLQQPDETAARRKEQTTEEVTDEGITEGVSEGIEDVSPEVTQRVQAAETNLKDTFTRWKESQRNLGVAFDPRSKAKEDVELLKALTEYVSAKVAEGAYNAKKFAEDLVSRGVEISNPEKLYKQIVGERKKQLKDITKKTKRVSQKLRGGKFYNRSLDVANFLGSLTKIGKITDPQLVNDIQNELNALLQRGIPDVDQKRINALTQRVLDADRATDTRTAKQKATSLISSLRNKEQPKNLQGVISFRVTAEKARNEVENALTLGEITEEEYNNLIEELDSLEEGVNSITPETADSYVALSQSKGNITRTRNRINQALEEGTISKEKADELLSGLEEAQERYDAEAKAFIDENNEKVRGYFSNNKASQLRDQFNLSEPQFILIDKLFDVFRRGDVFVDDVALSDKLSKLVDAFDNGFFPLKDVYEIYRYILSERNADDVVQVIESATKKFKGKSEAEIVRDFSATVLGFRSSKLGKGAKKSKALERTVYAPLIEAIEQSEAATNKILQAFEDATKPRRFSTLTPNGKKRRRRNVILAGVYMNQLNNYLQQGEGNLTSILIKQVDNSKVDVGSIDWLGIILGKEEAINALRGEINETTRQALLQGQLRQEYGVGDLKTMEEVWQSLPKNDDGSVNWEEFFENSEKYLDKETQNFILAANEAFNSSYEYIRAAKMMRGEPIDEVIAYYKRARLGVENADIDYRTISFTPNMRVVAGSSIDRVTNAVGAIDFNVLNTVNANAVESTKFFNFEINGGLVNSTLGKALQRSTQKQAVAAIKKDAKQSLNFTYSTKGSKVENFMSKVIGAKYVETLLRGGRLVAEVVSMILRMPFQTGTALSLTYMGKTKTLGRLQEISGINVTPQQSAQIEQGKMSSMRKRSRDSLKASRGKGLADYIGAAMGVAEIALRGGYTYPLFLKNFTMLTGESFDSSKLTDPDYVETYRQAITDAMALTKIENGRIYPTGNKFAERRKVKLVPYFKAGYVDADAWFGRLMNYMSTFVFKESETLFESARYTRDVFAEQGFTNKGVKEAATQVFTSRESGAAIGVLVGGYIYSYITGLDYLLTRLWDDDSDDEEKKQAIDMLQEQYGMTFNKNGDLKKYDVEGDLKGSFGVMQDQLAFFFIGRYGQALRLMTILAGSGIYSKTEDKGLKKQVQEFLRNNFYTNPVNMNEFALRSFAAENIPVIDMGVNVYLDMAEITMEAVDLAEKAVDGELDEEEKAFLRMFNIMFKTTNIALIGKGVQIPETRKIRREIEDELKKKEPKEKKMTFMK